MSSWTEDRRGRHSHHGPRPCEQVAVAAGLDVGVNLSRRSQAGKKATRGAVPSCERESEPLVSAAVVDDLFPVRKRR